MISTALKTCNSDEWATPQALYDKLNAEFRFDSDACATVDNALAAIFRHSIQAKRCIACKHNADESCDGCDQAAYNPSGFESIVSADALAEHDRALLEKFVRYVNEYAYQQYLTKASVDKFLEQEGAND